MAATSKVSLKPLIAKKSLKLLIAKKAKKVLYAEVGKETVDFLCSILTLPLGTVIRLLSEQGMVGSLPNLYASIESLNDDYIQPNQHKNSVLKPMACASFQSNSLGLHFLTDEPKNQKKFYRCASKSSNIHRNTLGNYYNNYCNQNYVSDKYGSTCPSCNGAMNIEVTLVEGNVGGGGGSVSGGDGLVKGVVTYMVMDDLAVAPMSTITGITLLNKFNVTNVGDLEEKVVDLDMTKALKLLKMSLQSKNVLTKVFL